MKEFLAISCVTNWISGDERQIAAFESAFNVYQEQVAKAVAGFLPTGPLKTIYVQFQYNCSGMPNAVRGIRVGRFSKSHGDVQAYVEVPKQEFDRANENTKNALLASSMQEVLDRILNKLNEIVPNGFPEFIDRVRLASK